MQSPLEHKMLGCLSLVFSYPWSSVPKPSTLEPRVVKLSRPCTKLAFLISWLIVVAQWLSSGSAVVPRDGWRGCPHPGTLSLPGSRKLSFTRSCGRFAPCLSCKALPSCLLAQAFFSCYREKGVEGVDSTISACSPVSAHPD